MCNRCDALSNFLLGMLVVLSASLDTQAQPDRPNIIFIMSDDHAWQAVSAYGSKLISTPNIDRIGKEGMIFKQAAVTNAICSPSRAVILTGKYSHVNGLKDNGTFFNGAQETLPKIFGRKGYATAIVGKWHLFSEPTGFDYWNILPDQGNYYNPKFIKEGKDTVYEGYVTDIITRQAIDWIDDTKDEKPFFLMLHHKAPHRSAMPPLKYLEEFNDQEFELPANFNDDYRNRKALQIQQITMKEHLDIRYDTKIPCDDCPVNPINAWAPAEYQREIERLKPEERKVWDAAYEKEYDIFKGLQTSEELARFQFQRFMEDYLRTVKSMDDNVGEVLNYLDSTGLAKNTIVVYMSDNGFFLGEHGLYDKRFMYEESFRVPMMIRYPEGFKGSKISDAFALNLDIAPTLLDLSGISVPSDMQGRSMKKILQKGEDRDWRKSVYYHYYERSFGLTKHYGIRTKRYKLIHFYEPVDAWELYDLDKDPQEMHNLYVSESDSKLVRKLKKELAKLKVKYGDTEL